MLLLFCILLLAFFAQRYVLKHGLDGVGFARETSTNLVDPEALFQVRTVLENRKRYLPVLLQIEERLPEEMKIEGEPPQRRASYYRERHYRYSQYLGRRAKVTRVYQASFAQRGRYYFRGAQVSANDFLGMSDSSMDLSSAIEMVVAPKQLHSLPLEQMLGGFLGDISVRRYIMEDPILTTGFREYTGREPLRAIAWNQSVKGQGLMVKQYDYTTNPSVTVVLSVENGSHEDIETCFSIARTACQWLEEKRIRYDFLTNASAAGALGIWNTIGEGLGKQHFCAIIEGLGRATYTKTEPLEETLQRAYRREASSSYLLILPQIDSQIEGQIQRFSLVKGSAVRIITPKEVVS